MSIQLIDCLYVFRSVDIDRKICREVAKSAQKGGLDPRFVGEGMPQILDMRFHIAVISEHVTDFG